MTTPAAVKRLPIPINGEAEQEMGAVSRSDSQAGLGGPARKSGERLKMSAPLLGKILTKKSLYTTV